MHKGFWEKLKKPIFALAPMANVTDAAFRRIIARQGKPGVFWTEFVSVDGLLSSGREKLLMDFWYTEAERPIVAQIFGSKPDNFREVAGLIRELGFDGIDINMGCPDRAVEKQGAGAALIKEPELAAAIIRATQEGAGDLPVSVKTRIGYNKAEMEKWLPHLLESGIAALTVHLRTRKEMSDVPAHWDLAPFAAALRDKYSPETLILGNGDVKNLSEAADKIRASGMDGVMFGRGIFGNPWLFSENGAPPLPERLRTMLEHTELFEELYKSNRPYGEGALKNFDVMKKHYKAYAHGFDGAKELRMKLMEAPDASGVRAITEEFISGL
jgi:nifR3 family TIM-barrel protein